jgi:hypothetical protein
MRQSGHLFPEVLMKRRDLFKFGAAAMAGGLPAAETVPG